MALRIKNVPITSNRLFKEHFQLNDVYPLLRLIVNREGDTLFTSNDDLKVFALLKDTCKEDFSLPAFAIENGQVVVESDERIALSAVTPDIKIESVKQLQVVLLCQLGGVSITAEELLDYGASLRDDVELVEGSVVIMHNDERKELKLFPYSEELVTPIYTIAIHNQSTFTGVSHLLVCNDEGKVIDDVRLGNDSVIYANCTNGYLIELLPQFSVSSDHYNYFDFRRKPYALCRKVIGENNSVYVYSSEYSTNLTQFTSDDERGLIGVKDGKLFFMSNIFNPMMDFQFKLEEDETIVKIEVKGRIYIVLTNKGRTFSNFRKMRLENIVSVGLSEACVPYAISSNGRLFISTSSECIAIEDNVYAVYSVDSDSKSIKDRDGGITFPQSKSQDSSVKMLFYKEHCYYIDNTSGSLYDSESPSPLAQRVLDFTLIKNGLNGKAGLAVYDGSNVEFINI